MKDSAMKNMIASKWIGFAALLAATVWMAAGCETVNKVVGAAAEVAAAGVCAACCAARSPGR